MTTSNAGGRVGSYGLVDVQRDADMAAYDALPPDIRKLIREMPVRVAVQEVAFAYRFLPREVFLRDHARYEAQVYEHLRREVEEATRR